MPRAPGGPRVAVTLGTILPGRLETMASILDGLARLDAEVVATVGPGLDPAELGPRPAGVHVERYLPMSRLLPTCDAARVPRWVRDHAGRARRRPCHWCCCRCQADQPENADRCEAAGVGIALPPGAQHADDVERAVRAVLSTPGYRDAAARVRAEIEAMPGPADVLPALERLAAAGPAATLID